MGPLPRLAAVAASLAVLASPGSSPCAARDGLPEFRAPLRADVLARLGRASFRHDESDLGTPGQAFDGKPGTVLRTRGVNPAFLEVVFDAPREVPSAEILFAGDSPHEWSLLAGDDPERLRVVFAQRKVEPRGWSRVERFTPPLRARVFRVVAKRLGGGDSIAFAEIALQCLQRPEAIEISSPSSVVCPDGDLVLKARVTWDGGYRSDSVPGRLWFDVPQNACVRAEPTPPTGPPVARLRYLTSGKAGVVARIGAREGGMASEPFEVDARPDGRPDWSVTYIERLPRLDFDGPDGGLPERGSAVIWRAHVRNYGTENAPRVPFRWEVDGKSAGDGWLEGVERYGEEVAELRQTWDGERHEVRFTVDPSGANAETCEGNNSRAVASDALLLGLWVERPLLNAFHGTQASLGDGANSWEDWAQRQVSRWNRMLAESVHPLVPKGCSVRVALDRVLVVEEGELPLGDGLPTDDPDSRDRTVDLQWGFPASLLDEGPYAQPPSRSEDNPLWIDYGLLRALSRARYLVDVDALDVRSEEVRIDAPDGRPLAGSPWLEEAAEGYLHLTDSCGLMAGEPSRGYGEHSAWALERVAGLRARGGNRRPPPVLGEYLGLLPGTAGIRVVDGHGRPVDGVRVRAWRRATAEDGSTSFGGETVREGVTRDGGVLDLGIHGADPFFDGEKEPPLDPARGVLLLELSKGGVFAYRFLEVVRFNLAFARGARDAHYEEIRLDLPR